MYGAEKIDIPVQGKIVEDIAECEAAGRTGKFHITDIYREVGKKIIVFLSVTAKINGLLLPDAECPEDIQGEIHDVCNIPEFIGITELHKVVLENDQVEELPLNVELDI
jgi:hypothetical protein